MIFFSLFAFLSLINKKIKKLKVKYLSLPVAHVEVEIMILWRMQGESRCR